MSAVTIPNDFFATTESIWGIFYPTNHIVAVFENYEIAEEAKKKAIEHMQKPEAILTINGQSVADDIEQGMQNDTWFDGLKKTIVSGLGNAMDFWEYDLKKAKKGAGFLVIFCPDEEKVYDIAKAIKGENPMSMRRYSLLAIEDLNATLDVNNLT